MAHCERARSALALLFIDFGGFKASDDIHGHHAGEEVRDEVARRSKDRQHCIDTASRIGWDEFVVLLASVADPSEAQWIARKSVASNGESNQYDRLFRWHIIVPAIRNTKVCLPD